MIILNDVTLLQLNCKDPDIGVKALKYSAREIQFAKIVLISHERPHNLPDDIEFHKIDKLSWDTVNKFNLEELHKYVETSHYLSIHADGFVINPHLWTDEFLEYDYIGAPWPEVPWSSINRVGNGGFRLESKRFLNLRRNLTWNGQNEDVMVTNTYRRYFEKNGCKYPSVELAAKFSLEMKIPEVTYDLSNCFGFHGNHTEESRQYVEMVKTYDF